MKRRPNTFLPVPAVLFLTAFLLPAAVTAGTVDLEVRESRIVIGSGLSTDVWSYNGTAPGTTITAEPGERMTVRVTNRLAVPTNIHWHGLVVPAAQDGPEVYIAPGETWTYDFTVKEAGTYWYHSHYKPALDQVDRGLYGAFIVRTSSDSLYSGDSIFVLDDWLLDGGGTRIEGTAGGSMERLGNIETVNGRTGEAIPALQFTKGELHKVRFINASTAAVHTLKISGHVFRVTHTDGHPLSTPYLTDTVIMSPGERFDAEVAATGRPGAAYEIVGNEGGKGMKIRIQYSRSIIAPVATPFIPPASRAFPRIAWKGLDATLVFNSAPGLPAAGGDSMDGMDMAGGMSWTVNGKSYPDTDPVPVKTGKVVKLRLKNEDTKGEHPMDHPIHIHGTAFQVVSVNGKAPERELWKDTVTVPAGQYLDIAFVMENAGNWLLHCHIFDHEDGGMVTVVRAR